MSNKAYVDYNGFLIQIYSGKQTGRTVLLLTDKSNELISSLREKNKPVRIIADLAKISDTTSDAHRQAAIELKQMDYDRMAICAPSVFLHYLAYFIIRASGKRKSARVFKTRRDADVWLIS